MATIFKVLVSLDFVIAITLNIIGSGNVKELFSDLVQKYYFPHIAPRLELYGFRVELIGSRMELTSTNTLQSVDFWRCF